MLNLRSYCLFLDTLTELKGIYGKHSAPSFENIILLITQIKYFTSFYHVRVVLMARPTDCSTVFEYWEGQRFLNIGEDYWLLNGLMF